MQKIIKILSAVFEKSCVLTATWPEGHWLNVRHFHHVTGNKSQTMSSCIKPLHLEKRETFCTLTQPNQIPTTLDIMGENLIFGSNLFNLLLIQLIQLIQLIDLLTCSNLGNIKSIQQTKLQKMAKNLFFGLLDHSKMHFCDL